jgi:hypothetical protein
MAPYSQARAGAPTGRFARRKFRLAFDLGRVHDKILIKLDHLF